MSMDEVNEMVNEWKLLDNRLVVERKADGKVIGGVGYWTNEDKSRYEMDWDFNPAYGKKGYATELARKLMLYIFEEFGIEELYFDCDTRNEASWRLTERLGFTRSRQFDNVSLKDDAEGNPIPVSLYQYRINRNEVIRSL